MIRRKNKETIKSALSVNITLMEAALRLEERIIKTGFRCAGQLGRPGGGAPRRGAAYRVSPSLGPGS